MMKVHIVEEFNTSFGTMLATHDPRAFKVGEKIVCDDDKEYTIKGIQLSTKPDGLIGLIV